jgi:hypothetical protein
MIANAQFQQVRSLNVLLRQPTALAFMLGHIQRGIQKLKVRQTYITPLQGHAVLDSRVLLFADLYLLRTLSGLDRNGVITP